MTKLTLCEFLEQKERLVCRQCGGVGLEEYRPEHALHVGAQCPACFSRSPLPQQWFSQQSAKDRRPKSPPGLSADEVWRANGDRCAYCGKSRQLCSDLGIQMTVQHLVPVCYGGFDTSPLIPFCSRCQQGSTAALQETRAIEGRFLPLLERFRRFEQRHPELSMEEPNASSHE